MTARETDGNGNTIHMSYNVRKLLMKKLYPNTTDGEEAIPYLTESYSYNPDGTLREKKDRNGITTSYVYDVHKRLINQIAGSDRLMFTYDNIGRPLSTVSGDETTTRTYDAFGRVVSKYVSGIGTASYTYDITAGLNPGETAERSVDAKGNETLKVYDRLGRVKEVHTGSGTTSYSYDENGNQAQVIYPGGAKEVYTYLKNNKLEKLENFRNDRGTERGTGSLSE